MARDEYPTTKEAIPLEDFRFLMKTGLLDATPEAFKKELISQMERVPVHAGERFIFQGSKGDGFYVIQEGSCIVSLEKSGRSHQIARLKPGDLVGEVAVLTGENRSASVDAATDMVLWKLELDVFEEISAKCQDLSHFLMEIATERLCSQKITAERSIGKYMIQDVLGEGGWSIVYKGLHASLNLPVAIKMLKHTMAADHDLSAKFQNEAKVIASLSHDNIVRVYDIEHLYRTVFIIMEYLDGLTVRHILRNSLSLPFSRVLHILMQVCMGLNFAHQRGIVHQDVKPGNIFIQKDDRVKIVDFGLACPIGGCSSEMPGTAFYMAPEQIEGDPVDPRTDIYALGITAYEMATGRRPFPDDVCEVLRAHITEPTPDPRISNPDLPQEFSEFVARATQKEPGKRYQGISEVLRDLNRLAEIVGTETISQRSNRLRMMSLFMLFESERQRELNELLESFTVRLKALGAEFIIADFDDIRAGKLVR